jgi:hypothetical protein
MEKYDQLKEKELQATRRLNGIRNQISNIEQSELLPAFKMKYEGRYFKYRNSFSCPEKESDYWWMYVRVDKVDNIHWMKGITFQTDRDGKISVEQDKSIMESLCQQEITKSAFDYAFNKMITKIQNIH